MSLQRQFEGPDVRALLDEIRAEYGADPTIAKAETFRTGGVLGFFQREHYRLVVDGQPAPTTPGAIYGPNAGATANRTEPRGEPAAAGMPSARPQLAMAAYAAITGQRDLSADPFAALAEETEDSFETAPAGAGAALHPARSGGSALATQTVPAAPSWVDLLTAEPDEATEDWVHPPMPSFETVLQRVADLVDRPAAAAVVWPQAAPGSETATAGATTFSAPAPAPAPIAEPAAQPVVEPAAQPVAEPVTEPAALTVTRPALPTEPAAPVVEDRGDGSRFDEDGDDDGERLLEVSGTITEDRADLRLALYRAGFNPALAAEIERTVTGRSLEAALLELFEELPESPRLPRRNGSLVVVVGSGRRAAAEATRIAGEVGADPAGVAFACERRPVWPAPEELVIHSAEDAMELAPGHRRGRIGVVAVDVPVGSSSTSWARHVIHALRPTLVVGVIDAMYKNEDIDAWVRALDGVDTLVVDNADVTTSPARVLDLELPVSRLGEQQATPARWTATVLDRVGAEAEVEG